MRVRTPFFKRTFWFNWRSLNSFTSLLYSFFRTWYVKYKLSTKRNPCYDCPLALKTTLLYRGILLNASIPLLVRIWAPFLLVILQRACYKRRACHTRQSDKNLSRDCLGQPSPHVPVVQEDLSLVSRTYAECPYLVVSRGNPPVVAPTRACRCVSPGIVSCGIRTKAMHTYI